MSQTKFIFVTGGVVSSLGKGIATSSIATLLESRGLKVSIQKMDPYINVDPGTMSPFQHGEVYVTKDGAETDLDLGHYERYTNAEILKTSNFTTGQVYDSVIAKERRGDYLGATVQVIPHVTDRIKELIHANIKDADIALVEVGGTAGDIESLPFLEAIRQFRTEYGRENTLYIHLTLVPYLKAAGEVKTKPTQHSVKTLQSIGIQPDILLCRTERLLDPKIKEKIGLFCNVASDCVITAKDVETTYEIPIVFQREGLDQKVIDLLQIWTRQSDTSQWEEVVHRIKNPKKSAHIAIVGKYVDLVDSYKSLHASLIHAGIANYAKVEITYVDSEEIEKQGIGQQFDEVDAILVPGGFGHRGVEGKIQSIQYARENNLPFFGICLGMQCAVIEFARHKAGIAKANSLEFDENAKDAVISIMEDQKKVTKKGGSMRLGSYPCTVAKGSHAYRIYGTDKISERHRHRFEVNDQYVETLKQAGLTICGTGPENGLVEMVEIKEHPWFIGVQFHPEFQSKPTQAHPLFKDFIRAAIEHQEQAQAQRENPDK
ncbi:MAG: CTP synthase [Bdellovibrionota bacterium]